MGYWGVWHARGMGYEGVDCNRIGWQSGRSGASDRSGYSEQSFHRGTNYSVEPFDVRGRSHASCHNMW